MFLAYLKPMSDVILSSYCIHKLPDYFSDIFLEIKIDTATLPVLFA